MKKTLCLLCFILAFSHLSSPVLVEAESNWSIRRITDDDLPKMNPVVGKHHIAWLADTGSNRDVYVYDGNTISRLSNTDADEYHLTAGNDYIAWDVREPPAGSRILLYDGQKIKELTGGYPSQYAPAIYGKRMVWGQLVNEIVLYDIDSGNRSQLIIPGGEGNEEQEPCLYQDYVSFTVTRPHVNIFYYDIARDQYHQITDNDLADYGSKINDHYIAYFHWDSQDREVMLHNLNTSTTTQLTDNNVNEDNLLLNGHYVIWVSGYLSDAEYYSLHLYDIKNKTERTIADNVSTADPVSTDGDLIVYAGFDGTDREIYVYDISNNTTTQLTDNTTDDKEPAVRDGRIAWVHSESSGKGKEIGEIMLATLPEEGHFFIINAVNGRSAAIYLK